MLRLLVTFLYAVASLAPTNLPTPGSQLGKFSDSHTALAGKKLIQEQPQRLVTFDLFDQRDCMILPNQKIPTHLPIGLPTYLPPS